MSFKSLALPRVKYRAGVIRLVRIPKMDCYHVLIVTVVLDGLGRLGRGLLQVYRDAHFL